MLKADFDFATALLDAIALSLSVMSKLGIDFDLKKYADPRKKSTAL